ncbi:MAG: hypothetical protein WBW88_10740 [Rhodothermales bacterium]
MTWLRKSEVRLLGLTLLIIGGTNSPGFALQIDQSVIVMARKPLESPAEARRIVADIREEAAKASESGRVRLGSLQLQSNSGTHGVSLKPVAVKTSRASDYGGQSLLLRTEESLRAIVLAGNLNAGVYTAWWVIFNRPDLCLSRSQPASHCDAGNLSDLVRGDASIYWAAGAVVKSDRVGLFHARTTVGDGRDRASAQYVSGHGLTDPLKADVQLVVKYRGPASSDIEGLSRQLTTLPPDCTDATRTNRLKAFASKCPGFTYALQMSSPSP